MAKGALAKEPKTEANPDKAKALEQYNTGIRMLQKYTLDNPRRKIGMDLINRFGPKTGNKNWQAGLQTEPGAKAVGPTAQQRFGKLNPEERANLLEKEAGFFYKGMIDRAQQYDPNKPFAGYEMGFAEARDKAYGDVMSQFNRSMEPEFQRQNAEFQQRMSDQGLDPNSGAYQAQYKALSDAQNKMRLDAQSQASQQAYNVQQQAFGQGNIAAMQPFQQWQAANQPYLLPYQQRADVNLANIQGGFNLKQAQIQAENALALGRMQGASQMELQRLKDKADDARFFATQVNQYGPQQQQPTLGQGIMAGAPAGIGQAFQQYPGSKK